MQNNFPNDYDARTVHVFAKFLLHAVANDLATDMTVDQWVEQMLGRRLTDVERTDFEDGWGQVAPIYVG